MEFNFKQLTFAREYRGYSQTELASKIDGLSQSNLSKYEKGVSTLSDDLVRKIIRYLNFPEGFFKIRISNYAENAHYRKKSGIEKYARLKIEYTNKLVGHLIDQMTDSLEWPDLRIEPLDLEDGYTPEYVAQHTRRVFRLRPDEPVERIIGLLERNGIIVVELNSIEKFDGVSFLTDEGIPVIIINKSFSNDRKRFTIAHELGHLIMHVLGTFPIPSTRDKEDEANRFASEFLMPKEAIEKSLRNLRLTYLAELKRYWLTSMASIVRRAKDLRCIDKDKYTYLNIELSRKGYKKNEPIEVFIDEPKLFNTGYQMHKRDLEYTDDELIEAFHVPLDVLNDLFKYNRPNTKLRVVT